jgi:hypothetical protein
VKHAHDRPKIERNRKGGDSFPPLTGFMKDANKYAFTPAGYQMQLQLLEEHNKKRLLIARLADAAAVAGRTE